MKFRKRPIVVDAVQITEEWFDGAHLNPPYPKRVIIDPVLRRVEVQTLEGWMIGISGDWIITGIKGEVYPCKPDVFEATYEPIAEEEMKQ